MVVIAVWRENKYDGIDSKWGRKHQNSDVYFP